MKELYDRVRTAVTNALNALSKQYEAEMEQQAEWVGELQEQVQRLEESVKDLKPQLGRTEASAKDLKQQVEILAANYKEIAEVLRGWWNAIWKRQQQQRERQRGPERDYGPSR